jgi:hypothetical protein
MTTNNTTNQTIYRFSRRPDEEVCVSLSDYKGKRYIDLRLYFTSKEDGELKPTKKGITLDVALYPELEKAIKALKKCVSETHHVEV